MAQTIWGIHAGRDGEVDALFKSGFVAIGFQPTPDLRTLPSNREAFKETVRRSFPMMKPNAIPNIAGQLFRFAHELNTKDLIVYRSKVDKMIHIGTDLGEYEYRKDIDSEFPHVRKVRWIKSLSPLNVTQGAKFEIGSALTLFQVRNYSQEWLQLLGDKPVIDTSDEEPDPTIGVVAEDIEELTQDFVLRILSRELKGHPFSEFIAHLLGTIGYRTRVSPPGTDGGVDIIAHQDALGFQPPIVKVQVKSVDGNVGQPDVSSLMGTLAAGEFGLFVSLSDFTPPAKAFSKNKPNLRLLNGNDIVSMILENYDLLDSEYKALIPLKRVFVPQPAPD